jgi:hypothetical protein
MLASRSRWEASMIFSRKRKLQGTRSRLTENPAGHKRLISDKEERGIPAPLIYSHSNYDHKIISANFNLNCRS